MQYGINDLGVERFYCKISKTNLPSLNLFKSLGYIEINYVEVFGEFELEFVVTRMDTDTSSFLEYSRIYNFTKIFTNDGGLM
jgi:RimJ/RimL family protein N-acetyltransferase